ncbi:hypothetical protein SPFM15_00286 [Salmonella phage SPFM15]|nr:hypothetical protein SPFM5_00281 [Salmonella phage SPFM5]VFR13910.1 hypothetical protein SPFM15_00286 [Salmonella phage SPFM15]
MREGEAWTSGITHHLKDVLGAGLAEHTISLRRLVNAQPEIGFDDVVDYVKQATVPPVFPVNNTRQLDVCDGVEIDWSSNELDRGLLDTIQWGFTFHPDEEPLDVIMAHPDTLKKIKVVNEVGSLCCNRFQRRCSMKNKLRINTIKPSEPYTDFFTAGTYLNDYLMRKYSPLC